MAANRLSEELLADSAAALRMIDELVQEIQGEVALPPPDAPRLLLQLEQAAGDRAGVTAFSGILLRAYREIIQVLEGLHSSRGLLEKTAVDRLEMSREKIFEVSSATEIAATSMLDGLDRAIALVDDIEACGDADRPGHCGRLRDELQDLVTSLQFQDITTQQLGHVSAVVREAEKKLAGIARLFDLARSLDGQPFPQEDEEEDASGGGLHVIAFDAAATTHDSRNRQDLADSIFG